MTSYVITKAADWAWLLFFSRVPVIAGCLLAYFIQFLFPFHKFYFILFYDTYEEGGWGGGDERKANHVLVIFKSPVLLQ